MPTKNDIKTEDMKENDSKMANIGASGFFFDLISYRKAPRAAPYS